MKHGNKCWLPCEILVQSLLLTLILATTGHFIIA